jgi:glycosyltransferase involved in cell wall biosynthesis
MLFRSNEAEIQVAKHQIFINARFLTQGTTGVQRYALELVKEIDRLIGTGEIDSNTYRFTLLAPKKVKYEPELKHISLKKAGWFGGHLWEQLMLPFFSFGGLLVNLCNTGPILKTRQIVTLHDASVFVNKAFYSRAFRIWYKVLMTLLGKVSAKVLTVSQFSKQELIRYCKIDRDKIQVTYNGKEHLQSVRSNGSILAKHDLGKKPYLLAVSSMNPNKNFKSILQALQNLGDADFDIVIAGGTNPRVFSDGNLSLPGNVKYLGYISDEELKALYENATCFIFPSFYEGFGIPPLEAMSFGCPVIVSNTTSLPEVCGDAALYCDPYDPGSIAENIRNIMSNAGLRKQLEEKGLKRAEAFSWRTCAAQTYSILQEVVAK